MELQIIQTKTPIVPAIGGREEARQRLDQERRTEGSLAPTDQVSLSDAARRLAEVADGNGGKETPSGEEDEASGKSSADIGARADTQLTAEERQVVQELRQRDREVRAHEQAHKSAAGPYAKGGPTFEYQTGPDGRRYAVGGEVSIDTSKVAGNPRATLIKAQTVRRAALAPSEPSAQDRSVAAQASQLENEARAELREQKAEEQKETTESNNDTPAPQETGSDEETGSTGNSGTDADNPFARRAIDGFKPSVTSGNLLDIIS